MAERPSIPLGKIIDVFDLEVLYAPEGYRENKIVVEDVNRPGLQLAGFFDYFDAKRLQVLGLVETAYLQRMTRGERRVSFNDLLSYNIPALMFARGLEPYPECMEMAEQYGRTVLRTQENTASIISNMVSYLHQALSPSITRHGVLMEVYGEGVMLVGESGVGKSETAIELIKRGHRLIADDAVEIRRGAGNFLIGTAPELIRYYMELRGIGIVDVRSLFGMTAVRDDSPIDLVINMETWKDNTVYDRLGEEGHYINILDVPIPTMTIPVKPGRNMAVIVEVAAMNNRQRKMGQNAAQQLVSRLDAHMEANSKEKPL